MVFIEESDHMTIPKFLRDAVSEGLDDVQVSPEHDYLPIKRKALLKLWLSGDYSRTEEAYRFLAVIVASKTVPIYEPREKVKKSDQWWINEMPQRLLQIAKACIVDELPSDIVMNLAMSYHSIIPSLDDDGDLDIRSLLAVFSAYNALVISSASNLVNQLSIFVSNPQIDPAFSNKDLVKSHIIRGDSAALSSVAWSCNADSFDVDPQKNLEFWKWYFNEAIPLAWSMAGYKE